MSRTAASASPRLSSSEPSRCSASAFSGSLRITLRHSCSASVVRRELASATACCRICWFLEAGRFMGGNLSSKRSGLSTPAAPPIMAAAQLRRRGRGSRISPPGPQAVQTVPMRVDGAIRVPFRALIPGSGAALLLFLLAACTQTDSLKPSQTFHRPDSTARVLLMPPDIELYELLASGMQEPRAEWTAAAKSNVDAAIGDVLRPQKAEILPYVAPAGDPVAERRHTQLIKLHDAVGYSILVYLYGGPNQLPIKKDHFDWTLGSEASLLGREYGADYALFVFMRDSYSSDGRKAMMIGLALLGIGVSGGTQIGFASLVDLKTGDIVWFNRLISTVGDLRTPEPARDAVEQLLDEDPL